MEETMLQASGHLAGERWAKSSATKAQLKRLTKLYGGGGCDWDAGFVGQEASAYGTSGEIFFVIEPSLSGFRSDAEEFWESICDERYPDPEYVKGFIEGAVEASG